MGLPSNLPNNVVPTATLLVIQLTFLVIEVCLRMFIFRVLWLITYLTQSSINIELSNLFQREDFSCRNLPSITQELSGLIITSYPYESELLGACCKVNLFARTSYIFTPEELCGLSVTSPIFNRTTRTETFSI